VTAATFHTRTAFPEARAEGQPGFLTRLYAAIMKARLAAAVSDIERRRHLVPENLLKKTGHTATLNDDSRLPFTH
jgi:hypothetical protein